ncbi:shikimate kinase [Aquimarina sp. MMG016]|uniref:shikimate kinase n=1 Tax=Aquimarina sp. MMG016 TaxID=2822690 RepID=UPI001B3A2C7A|nr:shikimate kinase [Aquimarina sp. MMG016]MBQ4822653.1 AAA family ATPase [Aquimarina sp. MMG016]
MNIVLMGYMGSGKSLIGRSLSEMVQMDYLDLDDYIETCEKKTIPEIFENHGEIYFRKKESFYLEEVLGNYNNTIISLGGGTPCFAGNIEIVKQNEKAKSIYLNTSLEELVQRLFKERNKRPLISHTNSEEELKDFVRKHLFERSFYYNQAEYKIITDKKTSDQIVNEIMTLLF